MKGAYAVFGAGSFGSKVAMELSAAGHHVVVVDNDREAIMAIRDKVTEALVADVSNPDVIKEIGKTSGTTAIMYYFTYWMPAAVAGKLFGRLAADIFLMLWTAAGIFLTLIGMAKINGRACVTQPIFYMFFGGLDVIPTVVHSIK